MNEGAQPTSPAGASHKLSGYLIVESGTLMGQRFLLPRAPGQLLLGRERECNIRFDPQQEPLVGRKHARIVVRDDGVYLIDLNSANGTYRNGMAIEGEVRLHHGERFQLGGDDGPWLSVQLPGTMTVTVPKSEAPTLVNRPVSAPADNPPVFKANENPTPVAPPASQVHEQPERNSAPLGHIASPHADRPLLPLVPRTAATSSRPLHAEMPAASKAPVAVDPVAVRQRTAFLRQVALIALMILGSCVVGLLTGLLVGETVEQPDSAEAR
ncbi:FHA domain-containing protein [Haliangium sp. UPWRP_2]|uniref:FHA domain-containing protein n=1 Tax=Haliangium sp. UPWRP_2 TaxID=1931276 RepID=UPI000B544088|nr:FHA domain-containing protein [Haliangium sp. UPWRP_2]PSM31798.1 hypothetical protein BVG81_003485 [Haliangium sp. UPWRP_2]